MQILCDKSQRIHIEVATYLWTGSGVPGIIFEEISSVCPEGVNFFTRRAEGK